MKLDETVGRVRVGIVVANPENGISLMRGLGPWQAMAREDRRLEVVLPRMDAGGCWTLGWDWLGNLDVLVLSAPYLPEHAKCALTAKMMGVKVWVDWDDDLTCVPLYNPNHHKFNPEQVGKQLEMLTRLADVVTVSTEELKRRREVVFPPTERERVQVVPNACHWPFSDEPRERRVTWRGYGNHDGDVLEVLGGISEVSRLPQLSRWRWTFIGEPPWQLRECVPSQNLDLDSGGDPFLYMKILAAFRPWVHIVPLRDNGFNRCRSNLAWIEASCAGAVVLAPDWEEWKRPGVVNYRNPAEFHFMLRDIMATYSQGDAKGPRKLDLCVEESRRFISEHLLLETVNERRWEILRGLINHKEHKEHKGETERVLTADHAD